MYKSTNLYFYFNTSNNKKEVSKTKKINGRTYAFNEQGIMMSGWDVYENPGDVNNTNIGVVYFSGEDDGHQVKKGWVYAVPAEGIDAKAYADDEEKYMYFNNSGEIVSDQFKKINGKYYVFNTNGIMKTGLIVWCAGGVHGVNTGKYVDKLDLDWATGEQLAKKGELNLGKDDSGNDKIIYVDWTGKVDHLTSNIDTKTIINDDGSRTTIPPIIDEGRYVKLHFFGEDGARKTGMNTVEFSDDTYTINTVGSSGDKGSGVFSKKYYSLGVLLKASPDIRYGIYQTATDSMLAPQKEDWETHLVGHDYLVLTSSGSKQKGNKTAKKDADGNYWMISDTDSTLMGIYTVGIKTGNTLSNFRTKTVSGQPWGNETTISTATLAGRYPDLFVTDYASESINGVSWTVHNINNSSDSYYTCNYTGPCFQSDYSDGSNKWIPFGMLDNSNKSATFRFTATNVDQRSLAYSQDPSTEYFLNCYWQD